MDDEKYKTNFSQDATILNFKKIAPHAVFVEGEPPKIENLNAALILIFAIWSGASHAIAQKILIEVTAPKVKPFEIFILDIDELNSDYIEMLLNGNLAHGYSESAWIENGQVVKIHRKSQELNPFIEYVIERNGSS